MNFEPQKLFVGLIDFFSILLPGALFTYLFESNVGPLLLEDRYFEVTGTEGWAVFLFSSYLLGHFIFLIGSWLDDLYNAVRKATNAEQVKQLANNKQLSPYWARWLASVFFKKEEDQAVNLAVRIKEHYLSPLQATSAVNAFQWCKARLTLEHPEAIATIQQFEADSKFFRSLLVVLAILIPWGLVQNQLAITLFSIPVLALAFSRYMGQRLKATNQAYWYIITLEGQRDGGFRQKVETKTGGMTHAGGVVFRRNEDQVEYLFVRAKRNPDAWVLPKGHVESGEREKETAVREVREETGVWASIKDALEKVSFTVNGESVKVQFYLMEAVEEGKPVDKRSHIWLPFDQALDKASHDETRELMRLAKQMISEL